MPRPVVIDTDGGVDDAVALWWALTDPALDVVAITVVWGNVDVDLATASVLRVVHAAGRADVPVAVGAPRAAPARARSAPGDVHPRRRRVGQRGRPGCAAAARSTSPRPRCSLGSRASGRGELTLVTLGPLTNVGVGRCDDHPECAADFADLVVMGGSARRGGNALPFGEANIAHDPIAAQRTVVAPWVRPPLLVGLDVTLVATLRPGEFELLGGAPHGRGRVPRRAAALLPRVRLDVHRARHALPRPAHGARGRRRRRSSTTRRCSRSPSTAAATRRGERRWSTSARRSSTELAGSAQSAPDGFAPWRIASGVDVGAVPALRARAVRRRRPRLTSSRRVVRRCARRRRGRSRLRCTSTRTRWPARPGSPASTAARSPASAAAPVSPATMPIAREVAHRVLGRGVVDRDEHVDAGRDRRPGDDRDHAAVEPGHDRVVRARAPRPGGRPRPSADRTRPRAVRRRRSARVDA